MDLGSYYSGKMITSGLFHLWLSEGIFCQLSLKLASLVSLLGSFFCLLGSYFHFHISFFTSFLVCKLATISIHHTFILADFELVSWSAHAIHIALPINKLLVSGISPNLIPYPYELLYLCNLVKIFPGFTFSILVDFNVFMFYLNLSLLGLQIDLTIGSLPLATSVAHHYYIAISFVIAILYIRNLKLSLLLCIVVIELTNLGSHLTLSINLIILSTSSMLFAPILILFQYTLSFLLIIQLCFHCFITISTLVAY